MENKDKQPKKSNHWMVLINISFQMGIIIFAFSTLGTFLDERYDIADEWGFKGFTLFGVFVSIYNVIRQVNQINKMN